MKTPTIEQINEFTAKTEAAMTDAERRDWFALSDIERKAIAWSCWIALHQEVAA